MASRRLLKKDIRQVCTALFAECIATSLYESNRDIDNVRSLLEAISNLERNYVRQVSHVGHGLKPKAFFKDLGVRFSSETSGIIDQINLPN